MRRSIELFVEDHFGFRKGFPAAAVLARSVFTKILVQFQHVVPAVAYPIANSGGAARPCRQCGADRQHR